jgi:hypothetical protein
VGRWKCCHGRARRRSLPTSADLDANPDDSGGFRLAFVESFRQWGIHPVGMRSMSVEGLLWPTGDAALEEVGEAPDPEGLRALFTEDQPLNTPEQVEVRPTTSKSRPVADRLRPWDLESDRYKTWEGVDANAEVLWFWLMKGKGRKWARAAGLVLDDDDPPPPPTVFRSKASGQVAVEVHSVRTAVRRTPRGAPTTDIVVEITQRRRAYFDPNKQKQMDQSGTTFAPTDEGDFKYRAGCTLLINPKTMEVRRVIRTPGTIADNAQLERVRRFVADGGLEPGNPFDFARRAMTAREPFALLHRHAES